MEEIKVITQEKFSKLKKLQFYKGKVVTGSMEPVIRVGDEILVSVGDMNLKRFDIVVILLEGKLVCHYLWRLNKVVTPVLLQTRSMYGFNDYPIHLENYFGKVISHNMGQWTRLKILFSSKS